MKKIRAAWDAAKIVSTSEKVTEQELERRRGICEECPDRILKYDPCSACGNRRSRTVQPDKSATCGVCGSSLTGALYRCAKCGCYLSGKRLNKTLYQNSHCDKWD